MISLFEFKGKRIEILTERRPIYTQGNPIPRSYMTGKQVILVDGEVATKSELLEINNLLYNAARGDFPL